MNRITKIEVDEIILTKPNYKSPVLQEEQLTGINLWCDVGDNAVWVRGTDEGVVVDIYGKLPDDRLTDDPIASTYAFDDE